MTPIDSQGGIEVAIALGSNLDDSLATLAAAVTQLSQDPKIELQAQSLWYQNGRSRSLPARLSKWLRPGTDTIRSPNRLLQRLLAIETQFGRVRQEKWGPRTLDLDILLFGNAVINTPTLTVPHPPSTGTGGGGGGGGSFCPSPASRNLSPLDTSYFSSIYDCSSQSCRLYRRSSTP